jgi:hypothetical protein
VTLLIGVDAIEPKFVVKHVKSFELDDLSEKSLRPFAEHVYEELLEHYRTPYSRARASIGFLAADGAV